MAMLTNRVLTLSAQVQAPFIHRFPIPEASYCEVDIVGLSDNTNQLRTRPFSAAKESPGKSYDISNGQALMIPVVNLFPNGTNKSTLILESSAFSKAAMTCYQQDSQIRLTAYTIPSTEYLSSGLSLLAKGPTFTAGSGEPQSNWSDSKIVSSYIGTDTTAILQISTTQIDPAKTNARDHKFSQSLKQYETDQTILAEKLSKAVTLNSGPGNIQVSRFDNSIVSGIAGYQVLTLENGGTFAISLPEEEASQESYLTHIFLPKPGQPAYQDWSAFIGVTSNVPANYRFEAYDGNGRMKGAVILTLDKADTQFFRPEVLFKDIPNSDEISWVKVQSKELIHAIEGYSYGSQVVALKGKTHLDLGGALVAVRVKADSNTISSFALLNPGIRTEAVTATAYRADHTILATSKFSLPSKQRVAKSITDLFNTGDSTLQKVSYVIFQATIPVTNASRIDFHNPVGRITGIQITGSRSGPFYVEGANLQNIDPMRLKLNSQTYNPDRNLDVVENEDAPVSISLTAISNDGKAITGWSYDPLGKGDLTKGFSASGSTVGVDRMTSTATTTVNGTADIPVAINGAATVINPLISILTKDGAGTATSLKYTTNLSVQKRKDQYDVNSEHGDSGYTNRRVKEIIPQLADLMAKTRLITQPQADYQTQYSGFKDIILTRWTNGSLEDGEIRNAFLLDGFSPHRMVEDLESAQVPSVKTTYGDMSEDNTGRKLMDQHKQLFEVGPKWFKTSPVGAATTVLK